MRKHSSEQLRVLMINRADARVVSGGDVVQLNKTRAELQSLGVSVDMRLTDELNGCWDYDLVHIFNIQTADQSWRACELAKSKGLPVALSPIYWNLVEYWYWTNPTLNPIWRALKSVLGRFGYPLYAHWQNLRSAASETKRVQQQLLLSADAILPNSHLEMTEICRDFALDVGGLNYTVVPNGIEQRLFSDIPKPSLQFSTLLGTRDFVLEVGRVSPEKNCLALINALWKVDIPIVFVGQVSPYTPEYSAECRFLGQKRGSVFFLDSVPYEHLPGVYAMAAVHALPSWRETPGLVSLEAAAAGCRVVSTSIGSAYEYLGTDAWYCHPANQRSIRNAVLDALDAEPSERLRQRVLNNYTWRKAAEATLAAYRSIPECRTTRRVS